MLNLFWHGQKPIHADESTVHRISLPLHTILKVV
uniref:Uncharacterized protein n=1 Tax=Rhizophora mucronata TaxID=61149 RepID=A0A2P2PWP8_RHIMU